VEGATTTTGSTIAYQSGLLSVDGTTAVTTNQDQWLAPMQPLVANAGLLGAQAPAGNQHWRFIPKERVEDLP
jgi:hypothetical protein